MTSPNFALHADAIIPVAGPENIVTGKSVIVRNGLIDDIVTTADALQLVDVAQIDLPGHTLMPGLVNAHGHAAMTLLRGYADDLPLDRWLNEKIWPLEGKWVAPDFVRDGTEIAAAEMILSGITTTSDMYFFPDVAAQALRSSGMFTIWVPCRLPNSKRNKMFW